MFDRLQEAVDKQRAADLASADIADLAQSVAMSEVAATKELETRTLDVVRDLKAAAGAISIRDALGKVEGLVSSLDGFGGAHMDVAPFLWAPKPWAMRSVAPAREGKPWPTETYGVAGWNIYWRNCGLGATALLLFQNNSEFASGVPHAAVVPLSTPLTSKSPYALVNTMLEEGADNTGRMALKRVLNHTAPLLPRMGQLAEQARTQYSSLGEADTYIGSREAAALYYMGYLVCDKQVRGDPVEQLRLTSLLFAGEYRQFADAANLEEWPLDWHTDNRRWTSQRGRKLFEDLGADASRVGSYQGDAFVRMHGQLTNVYRTGLLDHDNRIFTPESEDPGTWKVSGPPWLYRSSRYAKLIQAAFALPDSQPRWRAWMPGGEKGGVVGKQAAPVPAFGPGVAAASHNTLCDLVAGAYAKELGIFR